MKNKKEKRIRVICQLVASGKIDEARNLFAAGDTISLSDLATLLLAEQIKDSRERLFDFIIQLDPSPAKAWLVNGIALGNLDRHEEAIQAFDRALEIKPNWAEAWYNKGVALGNLDRDEEAIQAFDRALKIKPNSAQAWYNKATTLTILSRHEEAIQAFDRVLEIKPNWAEAWSNKGISLSNLGRYEEEIEVYNKALEMNPRLFEPWYNKGRVLNILGRHEEAIQALNRVLAIDPSRAEPWYYKGKALTILSRHEEAIHAFDRALEVKPNWAEAWSDKGVVFGNLGRHEEAIQAFDRALEIKPELVIAYYDSGIILHDLGRHEEATQAFDRALEIKPNWAEAWSGKGISLSNLGRYEEAIQALDKALEIDSNVATAWANRGIDLLYTHKYDEALRDLRRARELLLGRCEVHASMVSGYECWSRGMQEWGRSANWAASMSFREAAEIFRNCSLEELAASLKLLAYLVPIDEDLMEALSSQHLSQLREKTKKLSKRTATLAKQLHNASIRTEVRDLLLAKAACLTALANALEFQHVDPDSLDEARRNFRKFGLTESVKAANHLENFIVDLQKYRSTKEIPEDEEARLLLGLCPASVLNGYVSQKFSDSISKEFLIAKRPSSEELQTRLIGREKAMNDWVRICSVQLDFSLELVAAPHEFGYILTKDCREEVKQKVFSSLKTAQEEKVNIICFPELSFTREWAEQMKRDFKDIIIIGGSYYRERFNVCPIIIFGTEYLIRKIHPSPNAEDEVEEGRGMRRGKEILVFQTKFGRFAVLICLDYMHEVYRILYNQDKSIKNVDFIVNPCCNRNVANFQLQANLDCQRINYPYVLQTNVLTVDGEKCGGSCIIGMDHNGALNRYEKEGYRPKNDPVKYKLLQAEGEMMVITDLDIRRKGAPVPPSGLKMKLKGRYIFQDKNWQKLGAE